PVPVVPVLGPPVALPCGPPWAPAAPAFPASAAPSATLRAATQTICFIGFSPSSLSWPPFENERGPRFSLRTTGDQSPPPPPAPATPPPPPPAAAAPPPTPTDTAGPLV